MDGDLEVRNIVDNVINNEEEIKSNKDDDDVHGDKNVSNEFDVNPIELERRKSIVRQLMIDELGLASTYEVRGSDNDWAQAMLGHGSDLSSLTVKISKDNKHLKKSNK